MRDLNEDFRDYEGKLAARDARIAKLETALRHIEQASLNSDDAAAKLADIHQTASKVL